MLVNPTLLGPITSFKPWPCAGHPQPFLTAVAELLARKEVNPATIRSVRIVGCSDCHRISASPSRFVPRHGTPERLDDPSAKAIGERVHWRVDAGLRRGMNDFGVGIVEVEHEDETVARTEAAYPLGHPDNP